jgi:hypothetical protein
LTLGPAVGDQSPQGLEQKVGQELDREQKTQDQRGVGQFQNQPGLGRGLEPRTGY